jgi:hypothetical protein
MDPVGGSGDRAGLGQGNQRAKMPYFQHEQSITAEL